MSIVVVNQGRYSKDDGADDDRSAPGIGGVCFGDARTNEGTTKSKGCTHSLERSRATTTSSSLGS